MFSCKKEEVDKRMFIFEGSVLSWDSTSTIQNATIGLEAYSRKGVFGEFEDYNFSTCFKSDNNGYFKYEYEELDILEGETLEFSVTTVDGFSQALSRIVANLNYNQDWYLKPRRGEVEAIVEIDWNSEDTLYYSIEPNSITGSTTIKEINCFSWQGDFAVRENQNRNLVQSKDRIMVWSTDFNEFKRLAFEYSIGNRTDSILKYVDTFSVSGLPIIDKVHVDGKP